MKSVAYLVGGNVVIRVFVNDIELNFDHVVINSGGLPPNSPQEAWCIEDGQIKIDQQKLIEFNRQNMPNLNKRDFRKKLRDAKLFDLVDEYVKSSNDGYLQDAWDYSDYYSRTDPILIQAMSDLGITPEQADEIWTS